MANVERQFQPDRFASAQRHLTRALELDPAEQLAILLTLTKTVQSEARQTELTKRLVGGHPNHWATWILSASMPGISGFQQADAIAAKDRKAFSARVARLREQVNAPPAPCPIPP